MAAPFDIIENTQIPCLLNRKIDNGRFLLNRRLGHGGYSVVYLATDLYARPGSAYSSRVAVKCLLDHRKHKVMREVGIHQRAAVLPGVVNIFRTVQEGGLFFVVLEYCPHGDLFTAITNTRLFLGRDDLIKNVFLQLIDAVAGLHGMGIYHRDLKPENVLLSAPPFMHNKKQVIKLRVLLADFGLATKSERSESFGCGSYFYMTPECLAGGYSTALKSYSSRAADVWALGIILVNLICGRSPWKTAMLSDPSFRRYNNNSLWLRQMLPLSLPAFRILDKIFRNHGNNIELSDLRKQFLQIETFYMTPEELAVADKTARLVAREWMPDAPLDDINEEDPSEITYVDDIDEAQLFEDDPGGDDAKADSAPPSIVGSAATSAEDMFAPALSRAQTSSESDFPITPETKPVQPAEGVPELAKSEEMGQNWVLSTSQVHTFHKELTAAQDGLAIEQLRI